MQTLSKKEENLQRIYALGKWLREYDGFSSILLIPGCFDLLHPGHLKLLEYVKNKYVDSDTAIIVCLSSDEMVRKSKGEKRPIYNQEVRKEMLLNTRLVDEVIINDFETPEEVMQVLKPDFVVKGSDWKGKNIVEEKYAKVIYYDIDPEWSTTKIIEKIKAL